MENLPINLKLFWIINSWHCPIADTFFYYFRFLGNGLVLIPLVVIISIYKRWKLAPFLLAIAIETALVHILKNAFDQPRPALLLGKENIHHLILLSRHSFPSGDAAMAFAVAFILMKFERLWVQIALVAYAVLIAYGRIYIGVHFPLDVTVGAVVGIVSAAVSFRILKTKPRARKYQKDDPQIDGV